MFLKFEMESPAKINWNHWFASSRSIILFVLFLDIFVKTMLNCLREINSAGTVVECIMRAVFLFGFAIECQAWLFVGDSLGDVLKTGIKLSEK